MMKRVVVSKKLPGYVFPIFVIGTILSNGISPYVKRMLPQEDWYDLIIMVVGLILSVWALRILLRLASKYYTNEMTIDDDKVRFQYLRQGTELGRKDFYLAESLKGSLKCNTLTISDYDGKVAKIYKSNLVNKEDWVFLLDYFNLN